MKSATLTVKSLALLKVKPQFRANIYAQAIAFCVNILAYVLSSSYLFIWIELACLCFIGMNTAKAPRFFDRNILNHFISVMGYYILAFLLNTHDFGYFCLVFGFTYYYFILKDNGYNKSMQLWMYIQALLIGTTFAAFPFGNKLIATTIGYIEAQLILNLAFALFSSCNVHSKDNNYVDIFKLKLSDWLDIRKPHVRLAMRGSITAGLLYAICSNYHDLKPNWAVVVAISCLQRDDRLASIMTVKGMIIGTILAWPLAELLIYFCVNKPELATGLLWISLIFGLSLTFELIANPNLTNRILSTALMLLAVTCVALALQTNSYSYLNLKVVNSIIGGVVAYLVVLCWEIGKKMLGDEI